MSKTGRIHETWANDDAERQTDLDRRRLCASLTKPWVLPQSKLVTNAAQYQQTLPDSYQSIGSRGTTNLVGKMLAAIFPVDTPWFRLQPSARIRHDPKVPPEQRQALDEALYVYELILQSILESAHLTVEDNAQERRRGFRVNQLSALNQLVVVGDVLERMHDDFRIQTFRLDQYVTRRDTSGDVLYHVTKEQIDPLSLSEEQQQAARLPDGWKDKPVKERMFDLYTMVEWQPVKRRWNITQELNENEINTSEEKFTPYFSIPGELAAGEHYGRGFVELNLGDLRSLDYLEGRILDFAGMAAKLLAFIDRSSEIRPEDLMRDSGSVVEGAKVQNGEVQDVAFLKLDKLADFNVVFQSASAKKAALSAAMLIESEVTPRGDRVTRFQVQRIANELEAGLGGLYSPIADDMQVPLLRRAIHLCQKKKILPALPSGAVEMTALTGMAALTKEIKATRILGFAEAIAKFGEPALAKIDVGVLVDVLARYTPIDEPGLVKSNQQVEAEQQQAMRQQLQLEAGQQAIKTAGNVVEDNLSAS